MQRRHFLMTDITKFERLKDIGCLMWFPLNATYGLNDVIGGRTIVKERGTLTPQASGSYLITTVERIAYINISDLTSDDFDNGNYTTFSQVRRYENSTFHSTAALFDVNGVKIASGYQNNTSSTANWTNDSWNEGVIVRYKSGHREIYENRSLFINDDSGSYPDIWNYSTINIKSPNNMRIYTRNFLLFNKALTSFEVAEVHKLIS